MPALPPARPAELGTRRTPQASSLRQRLGRPALAEATESSPKTRLSSPGRRPAGTLRDAAPQELKEGGSWFCSLSWKLPRPVWPRAELKVCLLAAPGWRKAPPTVGKPDCARGKG